MQRAEVLTWINECASCVDAINPEQNDQSKRYTTKNGTVLHICSKSLPWLAPVPCLLCHSITRQSLPLFTIVRICFM